MAKSKNVKEEATKLTNDIPAAATEVFNKEPVVEEGETKAPSSSGPSYDELMDMVRSLANEVATLKSSAPSQAAPVSDPATTKILEMLSGRKSDREVVLVHNREMMGGLTTHLVLPNLTIDFRKMGEERILTWQQFEQCVSRYRSFFERGILLLGEDEADLAERYSVPCVKNSNTGISRKQLDKLGDMSVRELEDFFNGLSENDRAFLCSYWMGKCYTREPKFYDRSKIEALNRLAGLDKDNNGVFDVVLALMNNDFRRQ